MVVTEEKTGGKQGKKETEGKKRLMIIVATPSLPAVDDPNADHWNAARLCQKQPNVNMPKYSFLEGSAALNMF